MAYTKTSLMTAVESAYVYLVQQELNTGCDVNEQLPNGLTALMLACHLGFADIVRKLLSVGADKNLKDIHSHVALQYAANRNNTGCIDVLNDA